MGNDNSNVTYETAVRSFDHTRLVDLKSYHRLREVLNDIAHEADGVSLPEFLDAIRDMALTAPYADTCDCVSTNPTLPPTWPHKVDREDEWLTCGYRCSRCGREWTCGYSVNVMHWL